MQTCFVIQPFDNDNFDRRFDEVFSPAIKAAGLDPYRVDRDPKVDVLVDGIENGIRIATVCLADITIDNPNVWYELGFAFASGRPVVMVCSDGRTGKKYPFDIQHRTIIPYRAESPSDFEALKFAITSRIKGLMTRTDKLRDIQASEQVAPVQGLTQPELLVLAAVAGNVILPGERVGLYSAKMDVKRAGFTAIGFSLGVQRLHKKEFIELHETFEINGERSQEVAVTTGGWDWIERNEDKFLIRRPTADAASDSNDLPF
jgi:hypothetical protein